MSRICGRNAALSRGFTALRRAFGPFSGRFTALSLAAKCRGAGGSPAVVAAAVSAAIMCAGAALALDNTISNAFWCTWSYVNPAPNEAASSDGEVADTIIANEQPSNTLAFFRSYPSKGTVLMLR